MRLLVATAMLVLIGCAVLAANARRPLLMRIDAQGSGPWQQYGAEPTGEAPANLLVSPCPLSPQNVPLLPSERKA